MSYDFGEWVVYDPGYKQEIGRVTECGERSAFVCYTQGCTAASTPLCASRARRTTAPPRKEHEMIEIVCGSSPDELREADHITVNGVEFVTRERHDGAKDVMGDYLNDAHGMVRARDELIRDMYRCISVMFISCDQCDMRPCRFADRMRELGIQRKVDR